MATDDTDRPGNEIDKDYREVAEDLVDNQGWRYKLPKGRGYPRLLPPDKSKPIIRVPKTGHTRGHRFGNWLGEIRRAGGRWPPSRR